MITVSQTSANQDSNLNSDINFNYNTTIIHLHYNKWLKNGTLHFHRGPRDYSYHPLKRNYSSQINNIDDLGPHTLFVWLMNMP